MAQLTPTQFSTKWIPLLANNVFQLIDGPRLALLITDIKDSFASASTSTAPAVLPWAKGTYYALGSIALFDFGSGSQPYKALQAGYLPAPTDPVKDANWQLTLFPVADNALYQTGTVEALRQELGAWVPNRLYILTNRVDAMGGALPSVYVRARTPSALYPTGYAGEGALAATEVAYDLATDTTEPVVAASSFADLAGEPTDNAALAAALAQLSQPTTTYQLGLMQIGRGLFDEGNGLVSSSAIDWRNRLVPGTGNAIAPRHGEYYHFGNDLYISTVFLGISNQFVIRQSEFTYPDRYAVVYINGAPLYTIRPGGLMQFRMQASGALDIVYQTNSQPVYSNGLVPDALQAAVIAATYNEYNEMSDPVPDGSGASMQFFTSSYYYACLQIAQGVSGLRVLNWLRLPKVGSSGDGTGGAVDAYTKSESNAQLAKKADLDSNGKLKAAQMFTQYKYTFPYSAGVTEAPEFRILDYAAAGYYGVETSQNVSGLGFWINDVAVAPHNGQLLLAVQDRIKIQATTPAGKTGYLVFAQVI